MHKISSALHHRVSVNSTSSVVTPLYQNSAFPADSPYFYSRKANPNVIEIEDVVAQMEEACHCVGFSTGMAAINSVLGLLPPHSTIVVNRDLYGCSLRLLQREAERLSHRIATLDLSHTSNIEAIPLDSKLVFFETPTNPFLKTIDIASVVSFTKANCDGALVVVDNTWATPLFQQPLKFGADISLHSATKYISGHSDVMGGFAICEDVEIANKLRDIRFYGGAVLDPHSAWLLRRSAQTLDLRLQRHVETLKKMRPFLESQQQVSRVYMPNIDGRQLQDYGGILFFDLHPDFAGCYEEFRDALTLFGTGTGMAAVTSMIAQPYTGSHASLNDDEKAKMGLGRELVRLCFGLERPEDLMADLAQAFQKLTSTAQFFKSEAI